MTLTAIRYVPNFLPDILLTEKESDVIQKKRRKIEAISVMSTKPLIFFFKWTKQNDLSCVYLNDQQKHRFVDRYF